MVISGLRHDRLEESPIPFILTFDGASIRAIQNFRRWAGCRDHSLFFWKVGFWPNPQKHDFGVFSNSPKYNAHQNRTAILYKGMWSIWKVTVPLSKPIAIDGGQDGGRPRQGPTTSRLIPGGCDSSRLDLRVRSCLRRLRQQPTSSGYTPWRLPPGSKGCIRDKIPAKLFGNSSIYNSPAQNSL